MSENRKDPLLSVVGDTIRVKLLRVFVLNKDSVHTAGEFARVLRKRLVSVRQVLKDLEEEKIIKKKKLTTKERQKEGVRDLKGYIFNKRYPYCDFLEKIVRDSMPGEKDLLAKKVARVPGVQCVVTTNALVEDSDVDLVVASSEDNEAHLKDLVQNVEQSIGKELCCVFLSVNDLLHRVRMRDRFIRNILESEHSVHLDNVGLLERREK